MDVFKLLGAVSEVKSNLITITINKNLSEWKEAIEGLKVHDSVNVVITRLQITDWKQWLDKFNSIFTR